jgi:hypothetical protein
VPGDQIDRLAMLRIIKATHDIELQLVQRQGFAPILEIMRRLRLRAAESLASLAFVDAEDPKAIRVLQNEVKRYDEYVEWLRDITSEGVRFGEEMDAKERDELLDILTQTPEGTRQAIEWGLLDLEQSDA